MADQRNASGDVRAREPNSTAVDGGLLPHEAAAVQNGYASFSQIAVADWERRNSGPIGKAYAAYLPQLLAAFEASHGRIKDRYSDAPIRACVARTGPAPTPRTNRGAKLASPIPDRAKREDFHFVYDLAAVPIGGGLLTRIEMLATDASRLLSDRKLMDCLDELYSKATDLLGLIREQMSHSRQETGADASANAPIRHGQSGNGPDVMSTPAGTTHAEPLASSVSGSSLSSPSQPGKPIDDQLASVPELPGQRTAPRSRGAMGSSETQVDKHSKSPVKPSSHEETIDDKLALISHDLDVIELKYLITSARTMFFLGALVMTLAIAIIVALVAWFGRSNPAVIGLGRGFALVTVLGSVGALLSVVQRMSTSALSVRYDLGSWYTFLLGGFRPLIGAFAGFLVWLLVQSHALSFVTSSDYYLGAIALGLGVAERSVGDVVTQSGIADKLKPATSRPPQVGH